MLLWQIKSIFSLVHVSLKTFFLGGHEIFSCCCWVCPLLLAVTAYLQRVEYQMNLLNVWNYISYHQEIAAINQWTI